LTLQEYSTFESLISGSRYSYALPKKSFNHSMIDKMKKKSSWALMKIFEPLRKIIKPIKAEYLLKTLSSYELNVTSSKGQKNDISMSLLTTINNSLELDASHTRA